MIRFIVIIALILSLVITIMYVHIQQLEMRIDWIEDEYQRLAKRLLRLEEEEKEDKKDENNN